MGVVDLAMQAAFVSLYGLVLLSLGVLKVMPWRKQNLSDKLKDCKDFDEGDHY